MLQIIGIYRFFITLTACLSIIYGALGAIAFFTNQSEPYFGLGSIIVCIMALLSLGIPAILLAIMDDIKAIRKLQEEQAKKD